MGQRIDAECGYSMKIKKSNENTVEVKDEGGSFTVTLTHVGEENHPMKEHIIVVGNAHFKGLGEKERESVTEAVKEFFADSKKAVLLLHGEKQYENITGEKIPQN